MTAISSAAHGWFADVRIALSFLTRLPVAPVMPLPANGLADAMRAFPVAGAVVGLIGGCVYWASAQILTPALGGLLAVLATMTLTGGLHEDGLADTADGFGGRDRAHRLDIMRDSRVGTFGVLALVLSVGLRTAALAGLAAMPAVGLVAMIAAGALSRAVMPLAMRLVPPARTNGLGHGAGKPVPRTVLLALSVATVTALVCLPPDTAALAVVVAMAVAFVTCGLAERRIGGYTGDVLGALQQAVEIAVLLTVVASL